MASEFEEAAKAAQVLINDKIPEGGSGEESHWVNRVALSTMIMALLSAVGSLLAGVTANDILVDRTMEILEVSRLEADRVSIELLESKHQILTAMDQSVDPSEIEKIQRYKATIEELKAEVEVEESKAQMAILEHELFAIGVTLLSVAITLGGISLIGHRKGIWKIGLLVGVIGACIVGVAAFKMI
jgi:hypothetical protein